MNTDVDSFITANAEKYSTITKFQNLLNNITEDTFPSIIEYVDKRIDFFFKDRDSSMIFLSCIETFTVYNFLQFELILDVSIHFMNEIKKSGIDEFDLIEMNKFVLYNLNYLFEKKVISIHNIYLQSIFNHTIFINFYPEIDEYDHVFAEQQKNKIFEDTSHEFYDERYVSFMKHVSENINEHKKNRKLCFHPSPLHKSIRKDDIDTFQSILSKNNYSINYKFENSFYERAQTVDKKPSLIQVAAVYGSLNIFKFLWMQNNIEISENLIEYAVSGRNFEIIHICETKNSLRRALIFSIASHQNELSEYIIENTRKSDENKVESQNENKDKDENQNEDENKDKDENKNKDQNESEDENKDKDKNQNEDENKVKDENQNENNNIYSDLKYTELKFALEFLNYDIIIPCLKRIIKIIREYDNYDELEKEDNCGNNSFFSLQMYDLELFKFFYYNKNPKFDFFSGMNPVFFLWILNGMFDSIKFLAPFLNPNYLFQIFEDSIRFNPKIACFLMDLQFDEIKNKENHPIYDVFKENVDQYFIGYSFEYFNPDVMTKELNLYYVIEDPEEFYYTIEGASPKMLNLLFKNKLKFASKAKIVETAQLLKENGYIEASENVLKYNQ